MKFSHSIEKHSIEKHSKLWSVKLSIVETSSKFIFEKCLIFNKGHESCFRKKLAFTVISSWSDFWRKKNYL